MDIRHDMDNNRFVARTDHGEAVLQYKRAGKDTLDYQSTLVPEQDREEGIGEELVLHALEWAEENGFDVIPSCSFVKHVLEEHPERQAVMAR